MQLSTDLSVLPESSMIFAFAEIPQGNAAWTATASSGVLWYNTPDAPPSVPEPNSLMVLGSGLLLIGSMGVIRNRRA